MLNPGVPMFEAADHKNGPEILAPLASARREIHDERAIIPRVRKRQALCLRQTQWHSHQKANGQGRYPRTAWNKMAEIARPTVGGRWDTAWIDAASLDRACREYRQGPPERKGAIGRERRETGNPTGRPHGLRRGRKRPACMAAAIPPQPLWRGLVVSLSIVPGSLARQAGSLALTTARRMVRKRPPPP
jgi:hypothetical protein